MSGDFLPLFFLYKSCPSVHLTDNKVAKSTSSMVILGSILQSLCIFFLSEFIPLKGSLRLLQKKTKFTPLSLILIYCTYCSISLFLLEITYVIRAKKCDILPYVCLFVPTLTKKGEKKSDFLTNFPQFSKTINISDR